MAGTFFGKILIAKDGSALCARLIGRTTDRWVELAACPVLVVR